MQQPKQKGPGSVGALAEAQNFKDRVRHSTALDGYRALAGQPSIRPVVDWRKQPVDDSPLAPAPLLRHCANLLDTVVGTIQADVKIGQCGRGVIAHVADRLRAVAEVLR